MREETAQLILVYGRRRVGKTFLINRYFGVCGSATSWLVENIEHNKGGLFNRQTCRLFLEPFTLSETEEYLTSKGIHWSRYDITECYMIMGGIPYYLSLLDKEMSYIQNIDYLFFRKKAELWDEFEHLYNTLFTHGENYISVVSELSKKKSGLTREEISKSTGLALNGVLSKTIKNLVDSGFVRENQFFGKKKKDTQYQLADYYSNFYFHYLHDNKGRDEHFWSNTLDVPSRKAWAGNMFEQVCKDHTKQIKQKIGIQGILSDEYIWFKRADKNLNTPGTQIDLILDCRDRVIDLCEMKFSLGEFTIDKDYNDKLRNRIVTFRKAVNTKKAVQIIFITTYGVEPNSYSGIIQKQVILDDLFREVVD